MASASLYTTVNPGQSTEGSAHRPLLTWVMKSKHVSRTYSPLPSASWRRRIPSRTRARQTSSWSSRNLLLAASAGLVSPRRSSTPSTASFPPCRGRALWWKGLLSRVGGGAAASFRWDSTRFHSCSISSQRSSSSSSPTSPTSLESSPSTSPSLLRASHTRRAASMPPSATDSFAGLPWNIDSRSSAVITFVSPSPDPPTLPEGGDTTSVDSPSKLRTSSRSS
mmetsp:Transcript_8340/g.28613  ORF Transcript_8340/g.28613 Transcript_8340/m.28613 type:complete len:223 (-) Transcript_8340:1697-2365(-)